jgi:hypothetical protein
VCVFSIACLVLAVVRCGSHRKKKKQERKNPSKRGEEREMCEYITQRVSSLPCWEEKYYVAWHYVLIGYTHLLYWWISYPYTSHPVQAQVLALLVLIAIFLYEKARRMDPGYILPENALIKPSPEVSHYTANFCFSFLLSKQNASLFFFAFSFTQYSEFICPTCEAREFFFVLLSLSLFFFHFSNFLLAIVACATLSSKAL